MSQLFTVYDASGSPIKSVVCPSDELHLQMRPGQYAVKGDHIAPPGIDRQERPRDYAAMRASEYPPLAEQLDMLWHAMDSGQLPIAEPFYSQIKAVKEAHPKDATPGVSTPSDR